MVHVTVCVAGKETVKTSPQNLFSRKEYSTIFSKQIILHSLERVEVHV